ncbi:serine protease [Anaerobacillus alkalidiazotrophicus]|uniref:Serine protease n=1 Tax=Anaerobacillus alkalidiazotrophicus TaxID=472963 RepID=A0A1S2MCB6_9BACI|nr:trypsin-like peptidase domain-containing protein [Anaerobacillus alkalidiazotrophicus]OIJ22309.1 serine protease [Anaerobacillus alkalidiazotrophicus]
MVNKRRAMHFISIISTIVIIIISIFSGIAVKSYVERSFTVSSVLIEEPDAEAVPASTVPRDLKDIIHETQKKVVNIETDNGFGSGFLYTENGDVVTNAHVVANVKEVHVKTSDGRSYPGTVIGISSTLDLAVVRVSGLKGNEPLTIHEKRAEIGDEILALGSPLGYQNTVTTGIISGVDRNFEIEPFHFENVYQISAPIAPGNSGGPLVEATTGEVFGINSAGANQGNIGFSIPIIDVVSVIDDWITNPLSELPTINLSSDGYEDIQFSEEELAGYIVSYFYESLSQGDYVTAYSLLGSEWQKDMSYESFRNGYQNTLAVSLDDLTVVKKDDGYEVIGFISALERQESLSYQSYKVTYFIRYENDQLKIISGKGEKV